MSASHAEPVVVTGIGIYTSIGSGLEAFGDAILAGRGGLSPITAFNPSPTHATHAGIIQELADTPVPPTPRELGNSITQLMRKMDRVTKLSVLAATQARLDAGIDLDAVDPTRIGIVLGTAFDGLVTIEEYYRAVVTKGAKHASPTLFPYTLPNSINGAVSIHMGIKGVNSSLATGVVSGLASVGYALDLLRANRADYVLAGGADIFGEPLLRVLDFLGLVSPGRTNGANGDGAEVAHPFGADRNGFVMGEAGAFVVLERRAHAAKRGARIHAELAGYCNTFDAYRTAEHDPSGRGVQKAIEGALADAGRAAADVDYVAASANSSRAGDLCEARGIHAALGARADDVPVSSVKGLTGETFSAGGVVALVQAIVAMQRGAVPPNGGNGGAIGEDIPLKHIPRAAEKRAVRVAVVDSVCYTGNNASAVVAAP